MRPIDGEKIRNDIALYLAENAYLNDTALDALKMVAKWLNEAPTLTADDYFDAVDRIKPCPNCRYTLFGALTEDEPRWISVTERLPEKDGYVTLVHGNHGGTYVAEFRMFSDYGWEYPHWYRLNAKSHRCKPTHWMPLPEPPKED